MEMPAAMSSECSDLSLADVESAKPSAAFMSNGIIEKKRRQAEMKRRGLEADYWSTDRQRSDAAFLSELN